MRKLLITLSFLCLAAAPALFADEISFTLDPGSGVIAGAPGETIGWGFTLTNDTDDWITVTSSDLENETDPDLGVYTDFISAQGGNAGLYGGALAPYTTWTEAFDGVSQGAGSYTIDPSALYPATDDGLLSVYFDIYDGDPGNGGNYLSSSLVQAGFEVETVPEPGPVGLLLGGLSALGWLYLTRRRRAQRLF
jgi:hypothetical protein